MEFKTSSVIVIALLASLTLADDPASTLPVLYRVDQPTSNVVVFRGANVALARAAGLIRTPAYALGAGNGGNGNGNGNGDGSGNGNGNGNGDGSGNGNGNNGAYGLPPPPTTTPPPPPPPTTTPAPVYVAPPPAPIVYRAPAPAPVYVAPAPVIVRAPVATYGPVAEPEPAGPANYNWEYAVQDNQYNDFGHKETRDGYLATGKYYVNLPDGRTQVVTYTADANGYTPVVEYTGVAQYPEDAKPTYN